MKEEIKRVPPILKEYFAARKELGELEPVYYINPELGQEFYPTGEITVKKEFNGEKTAVIVVQTREGVDIPLEPLLAGLSTLGTFETEGCHIEEHLEGEAIVSEEVHAGVVKNFQIEDVFQPITRNIYDFLNFDYEEKQFTNKIIRYLGKAIRSWTAKRDDRNGKYRKGMRRVAQVQLWEVRPTEAKRKRLDVLEQKKKQEEKAAQARLEAERKRREQFRFNENNAHYRDSYLSFNSSTHVYSVGGTVLQSVTDFVDKCFPKFDVNAHARQIAARMGISEQEVIAMWEQKGKESREAGTIMHKKIEHFYLGISEVEDETFRLFKQFANQIQLKPYRTEWSIYDVECNIAGTVDFVDCQNGRFVIYDWKRSEKLIINGMPLKISLYDEKALYPIEHIEDCAYYHYALQLSIYKYILEKNYGLVIDDLRLGIFHPSYHKPYVMSVPYLEEEVKTIMKLRSGFIL